jgi:CBS domain-containing protein
MGPSSLTVAPPAHVGGDHLDTPVRDVMTPGVLSIVEDASLRQVLRALHHHRVHAVLVSCQSNGLPLGWVTARGLLGWIERDHSLSVARDAITEPPLTIEPGATIREAVSVMAREGVGHLLVAHRPDALPEGVLADLDVLGL